MGAHLPGAQTGRRGGAGPAGGCVAVRPPPAAFLSELLSVQLREQLPEVLPITERIKSRVGLETVEVGPVLEVAAPASLLEQGHGPGGVALALLGVLDCCSGLGTHT